MRDSEFTFSLEHFLIRPTHFFGLLAARLKYTTTIQHVFTFCFVLNKNTAWSFHQCYVVYYFNIRFGYLV